MIGKNIKKSLKSKIDKWIDHVDDDSVKKVIKENAIITGGAIVSMLNNEKPNDYDIYFKDYASCLKVVQYYAALWNEAHPQKVTIIDDTELFNFYRDNKLYLFPIGFEGSEEQRIKYNQALLDADPNLKKSIEELRSADRTKRISCFISSAGVAKEDEETGVNDETEPDVEESVDEIDVSEETRDKPKYRPVYFSTNAISLSDSIQLVIRFYGTPEEIHKNYDFIHCTCWYSYYDNTLDLPSRALEAIINKELYYVGSKYPLCSIIRTRKFLSRGWTINAGQYLKMALQLNELDLTDLRVFEDQLAGVDSAYFNAAIAAVREQQQNNPEFKVDNTYLFEVINRIF